MKLGRLRPSFFIHTQENIANESSGYKSSRYKIVALSLGYMMASHKDFKELLVLLSLLDSQNIPRDLLDRYKGKEVVDHFLHLLKRNSFIIHESSCHSQERATFSLHRSTHEILRYFIKGELKTKENKEFLPKITRVMEAYVRNELQGNDLKHFNFVRLNLILAQMGTFLVHQNLTKEKNAKDLGMCASLFQSLGIIARELGDFEKSAFFLQKSYEGFQECSGRVSEEAARSLGNLAVTLGFLGKYAKAKAYHQQALVAYQKTYGKDHLEVGWLCVHFGNTNRDLGQFDEARVLYETSYQIFLKNEQKNHYHTAWFLGNLGDVYRRLGFFEKAKDILEESLRIYKSHYQHNSLRHAWGSLHLGKVYMDLTDFEGAQKFFEESLAIYRDKYGNNHIKTMEILTYLARVYTHQGRCKKAQGLFKQCWEAYKAYYGEGHVATATVVQGWGECFFKENNLHRAEECFEKALLIFQQAEYPERYQCLENLAAVFLEKANRAQKQGRQEAGTTDFTARATQYLKQALHAIQTHFPKDSPHYYRIYNKLNQRELGT